MAAVQMNTRIDEALKAEGDAAFAKLGYSPSEAVRLLWGFAARNQRNQRKMTEVIQLLKDPREVEAERKAEERRRAEIEAWDAGIRSLIQGYYDEFGIDRTRFAPLTYEDMDEILADALTEDAERIRRGE